jgi:hypothetical protein
MKNQKLLLLVVTLLMIGGTGALLAYQHANQSMGKPGVRTEHITTVAGEKVILPEKVLDFTSREAEQQKRVIEVLPADTCFGQRIYRATDGFEAQVNVVLMGGDRTSLHKPQICLLGSGWKIDKTEPECVKVEKPFSYDLPVMKLTLSEEKPGTFHGQRGVYVYWFVADHEFTREHSQRMWWMAKDLLTTGILERWSYITFFATCPPGREQAAYERLQQLIAAAVPDFQTYPRADSKVVLSR